MSSRTVWYGIAAVIVIVIVGYGLYSYSNAPKTTPTPTPTPTLTPTSTPTPTPTPTSTPTPTPTSTPTPTPTPTAMNITLYGGMVSATAYGFGFTQDTIKSNPSPTLNLTVGVPVNLTFIVVGNVPHAFKITAEKTMNSPALFGSEAGTSSSPILPGNQVTITFTPTEAGDFYYVCPVPGHIELGMWGYVKISQ
jgi:plastocyanin